MNDKPREYEDSHHADLKEKEEEEGREGDEMPEEMPGEMPEAMEEGDDGGDDGGDGESVEGDGEDADRDDAAAQAESAPDESAPDEAADDEEGDGVAPPTEEDKPAPEDEEAERSAEGGVAQKEEGQEGGEGEEPEEEEEEEVVDEQSEPSSLKRQYEEQQVLADPSGKSSAAEQEEGDEGAPPTEATPEEGVSKEAAARRDGGEKEDGGEYVPSAGAGAGDPPESGKQRQAPPPPNPYNRLGDALQFWNRQLELVQREPPKEDESMELADPEKDDADAPPAAEQFELVGKGEASDAQTMADATREQFEQMESGETPEELIDESAADDSPQVEEPPPPEEKPPPSEAQTREEDLKSLQSARKKASGGALGLEEEAADTEEAEAQRGDGATEAPWEEAPPHDENDPREGGRIGALPGDRPPIEGAPEAEVDDTEPMDDDTQNAREELDEMRAHLETALTEWQLGIFFRPPTHFSHMPHPTFPISHLLFLFLRRRARWHARGRVAPLRAEDLGALSRAMRAAAADPRGNGGE